MQHIVGLTRTVLEFGIPARDSAADIDTDDHYQATYWLDVDDHNVKASNRLWSIGGNMLDNFTGAGGVTLYEDGTLLPPASLISSWTATVTVDFLDTDGSVLHTVTEVITITLDFSRNAYLHTTFTRVVSGSKTYYGVLAGVRVDAMWTPTNDSLFARPTSSQFSIAIAARSFADSCTPEHA